MSEETKRRILIELESPMIEDNVLFQKCLTKADGNQDRAELYYFHQRLTEINPSPREDFDSREKWPMLKPLLILYTVGTMGVLALVFGYLFYKGGL